jgi:excisionase family DNA binding protein
MIMPNTNPDVFDARQFAAHINAGYRTALKIIEENRVQHVRLGKRGVRISREAADQFLFDSLKPRRR